MTSQADWTGGYNNGWIFLLAEWFVEDIAGFSHVVPWGFGMSSMAM